MLPKTRLLADIVKIPMYFHMVIQHAHVNFYSECGTCSAASYSRLGCQANLKPRIWYIIVSSSHNNAAKLLQPTASRLYDQKASPDTARNNGVCSISKAATTISLTA